MVVTWDPVSIKAGQVIPSTVMVVSFAEPTNLSLMEGLLSAVPTACLLAEERWGLKSAEPG